MPKQIEKRCYKHGLCKYVLEGRGYYRCFRCRSENVMKHRKEQKKKLIELFGGKCQRCGYSKSVRALTFHHRDRTKKEISFGFTNFSWKRLLIEAKKCDLLCANCHMEIEEEISVNRGTPGSIPSDGA